MEEKLQESLESHFPDELIDIVDSYQTSLIVAGYTNGTIRIWSLDVKNGRIVKVLEGHTSWVNSLSFHSQTNRIVSGSSDNTIRIWDIGSGKCLQILYGHSNVVNSVAINAEGNRIVSGSHDGTVRIWSLGQDKLYGKCLHILQGHSSPVTDVSWFTPTTNKLNNITTEKQIISISFDNTTRIWSVGPETVQCLQTIQNGTSIFTCCAVKNNRIAYKRNSDIKIYDLETGQCLQKLKYHYAPVSCIAWRRSTVGNDLKEQIVTGSIDKTVRILSLGVETNHYDCKILKGHTMGIRNVSWSENNSLQPRIVSVADDTVRIWSSVTGECLYTLQEKNHYPACAIFI